MSQTNETTAVQKTIDLMREHGVCEEDIEAVATILRHNDPERKLSQDELTQRFLALVKAEHNLWLQAANWDDVSVAIDRAKELAGQWAFQKARREFEELYEALGVDIKFLDEAEALFK